MPRSDRFSSGSQKVVSPFSDAKTSSVRRGRKKSNSLPIVVGVVAIVLIGVGSFFFSGYLSDPLRTLEPFPVVKYLENYKSVAGARFRASLQVENDLGWKDGVGRLMVFSVQNDPHSLVVMIPPNLAQLYFTKGQNYLAELEVKEGGLVYAYSCKKN